MPEQTLPSTPGARIALLVDRSEIEDVELAEALLLPGGTSIADVYSDKYELSATDLVIVADLLDVPVTVLTGQLPLDRHLGASLRLGASDILGAPIEALEFADVLLKHQSVLDSWLGSVANILHDVPMSNDRYFLRAGQISAARVRDALQLGEEPIPDLLGLVEDLGFPVVFRRLPEDVHGLNIRDEREGRPTRVIVISVSGPWTMQRYTIAHELCHALYDDKDQIIVDRIEHLPDVLPELRAENFARYLLLPSDALRRDVASAVKSGLNWPTITARLMLRWGVSRKVLTRALVDDKLANQSEISRVCQVPVYEMMKSAGLESQWDEFLRGQEEETSSQLLVERAIEAFSKGWVSSRVVAEILDQSQEATDRELAAQGWVTRNE